MVGIPLEVDSANIKRWEFIRVKIGCRDITKVLAVVEGLLDFHFYDFTFQREVPQEGVTNAAGTSWTKTTDRPSGDFPSPKNLDGVMAHHNKIRGVKLREIQLATLKKMVINEGRMMNLSKNLEG